MVSVFTIDGISVIKNNEYAVFYIDFLSEELKTIIRDHLSKICWGTLNTRLAQNYKNTLKEFFRRFDNKEEETKKGMIGELLTHILIISFFSEFNIVSPFFNLEERSIKKGFDVVLFSEPNKEIWLTEIKSGALHQNKNANQTTSTLLGKAKRDIKDRLNDNDSFCWENAITGAKISLEKNIDMKDEVIRILELFSDEATENNSIASNKNVVLVSSLFSSLSDRMQETIVADFSSTTQNEAIFKQAIVVSIQKGTYQKVVDFLKSESES